METPVEPVWSIRKLAVDWWGEVEDQVGKGFSLFGGHVWQGDEEGVRQVVGACEDSRNLYNNSEFICARVPELCTVSWTTPDT